MEIFRKQIRIDEHVSRQHSLIPYINKNSDETSKLIMDDYNIDISSFSDNGNWGQYPCDIDILRCENFLDFRDTTLNPQNLLKYFQSNIVSFFELSDRYNHFKKILRESKYLITISKGDELKWVEYTPTLKEQLRSAIVTSIPIPTKQHEIIGVYKDNYHEENGGCDMMSFLIKAMGLFIINPSYVNNDNGVPEIMPYTGIKEYLRRMEVYKNSNDCCKTKEYEFLGGDVFYHYLNIYLSKIEQEIKYWYKALARDESYSIKASEPHINMDVALNSDSNVIGNFSCVEGTETEVLNDAFNVKTIDIRSQLQYLRRTKITYCEQWDGSLGGWVTGELPLILDETEVNGEPKFKLTQPYQMGYPKNLQQVNKAYYGDMIYRMEFIEVENTDNPEITGGIVNIYYVIGGKLTNNDNIWHYANKETTQEDTPDFNEFVRNPKMKIKWTVDNYLFLKNELSKSEYYENNEEVFFKGDILDEDEEIILRNEDEKTQTWVYRINYRGKYEGEECYPNDYVIFYSEEPNTHFHFTMNKVTNKNFTGIRYYEQKPWVLKNYRESRDTIIYMLTPTSKIEQNILITDSVINSDGVIIVDYSSMDDIVTGVFASNDIDADMQSNNLIMTDYEFGKIDFSIENSNDILIDRGFVTSFELHYKLGEINTMEDMENYGNNFFGF